MSKALSFAGAFKAIEALENQQPMKLKKYSCSQSG
jgi:hypothetical protein